MRRKQKVEFEVVNIHPTYESEEAREEARNRVAYDIAMIAKKHRKNNGTA